MSTFPFKITSDQFSSTTQLRVGKKSPRFCRHVLRCCIMMFIICTKRALVIHAVVVFTLLSSTYCLIVANKYILLKIKGFTHNSRSSVYRHSSGKKVSVEDNEDLKEGKMILTINTQ